MIKVIVNKSEYPPCNRCGKYYSANSEGENIQVNRLKMISWLCERCYEVIENNYPDLLAQHIANWDAEYKRRHHDNISI